MFLNCVSLGWFVPLVLPLFVHWVNSFFSFFFFNHPLSLTWRTKYFGDEKQMTSLLLARNNFSIMQCNYNYNIGSTNKLPMKRKSFIYRHKWTLQLVLFFSQQTQKSLLSRLALAEDQRCGRKLSADSSKLYIQTLLWNWDKLIYLLCISVDYMDTKLKMSISIEGRCFWMDAFIHMEVILDRLITRPEPNSQLTGYGS